MKNRLYILLTGLLLLLFGGIVAAMPLVEGQAQETITNPTGMDSQKPPPGYRPIPVKATGEGFSTFKAAVFMDYLPWGSSELFVMMGPAPTGLDIPYDIYNSADFATANLSNYKLIIIAEDQNQNFYNLLAANMWRFENYLQNTCGVLQAHTAGWGWNWGDPSAVVLPGGVTVNGPVYAGSNFHNGTHPITFNPNPIPNPFGGTYASHGYYDNLVPGTTEIAHQIMATAPYTMPTLIEYPFGQGRVLAGMQTYSYGALYGQTSGDLLWNMLQYSYYDLQLPCAQDGTYIYSAKFVCGGQYDLALPQTQVVPGIYATEVNIHNFNPQNVKIEKHIIPLVLDGEVIGREPDYSGVWATDGIALPPDTATMDDCYRLAELLYSNPPPDLASMPMMIGFLEIISPLPLHVDAVYTAFTEGSGPSIDVERVEADIP